MKKLITFKNGKLTTDKALSMLRADGLDVSYDEAKKILEFLTKLANIAVSNHLSDR